MIWKVEAEGDVVYVKAETVDEAERKFENAFGSIPASLTRWTRVDELPDGESFIYPD